MDFAAIYLVISKILIHQLGQFFTNIFIALYKIKKSYLIIVPLMSSLRISKLIIVETSVPNSNFCLKFQSLSLATNTDSCFSSSGIFKKMTARYATLINHSLMVVLLDKNGIPLKSVQFNLQLNHTSTFLKNNVVLKDTQNALCGLPILFTQTFKKMYTQELKFNALSKTFLSKLACFCFARTWQGAISNS